MAELCGVLVVDKPEDFTSFDVVAKLRGICRTRKMGHGGTLDPMATGVLPVFIGPAVKAVDLQPRQDKAYEAELLFGVGTDTGDITGEVLRTGPANVEEAALRETLAGFVGEGMQTPPMVSAVKVQGKPLYKYAREGQTVERKPRPVTIHSAECLGGVGPGRFRIAVHCSKGTYIRVLAEDLGERLGTPATLAALRRTAAGAFALADAHSLEEIQQAADEGTLPGLLTPVDRLFADLPAWQADEAQAARLFNGAPVYGAKGQQGRVRLYAGEAFLGLGMLKGRELRAEKLFVQRT